MEFTIYSVGSAHYLSEILNSVAMMSGTGSMASSAKVGLLVGMLIAAFQALVQGTGIQFQKVLVCLLLYMMIFGSNGTAVIEDVYSGEVATVDNVPLGPLAAGSMISTLGYKITDQMEQAFSTPAMTERGFADPLNVLAAVRQTTQNIMNVSQFNAPTPGTDLLSSWGNYIRECTMVKAASDPTVLSEIQTGDPIQGLKFTSEVYGTRIFIDGAKDLSCSEAFETLNNFMNSNMDAMMEAIGSKLPEARSDAPVDGALAQSRVNDALNKIGMGMSSAQDFVKASVLLPLVQSGPQSKAIADQQGNAAVMMNQASLQLNTQWAGEGSMFTKYARPFMTFFEGFIYAITPIIAFLIVLGPQGISLVGKYLLILCWLMLWMPIMAVVNLYLLTSVSEQITGILGNSISGLTISYAALIEAERVIEREIGVAGLMLSSVPGLVMFLLYGTSVAATSMASRLGGSDTINEKMMSPDAVQPNSVLAMSSQYVNDPVKGTMMTGSSSLLPTLGSADQISKNVESARSSSSTATQQWADQSSTAMSQTFGNMHSIDDLQKFGHTLSTSSSEGVSADANKAVSHLMDKGFSRDHSEAAVAAATAGVGLDGIISFGGKSTSSSEDKNSAKLSEAYKELMSSSHGAKLDAARTENHGLEFAKSLRGNSALQDSIVDGKSLSETGSQALAAQESFKTADSVAKAFKFDTTRNAADWAALVGSDGAAKLQQAVETDPSLRASANRFDTLLQDKVIDSNQRATIANIWALGEAGRYGDLADAAGLLRNQYDSINSSSNASLEQPHVSARDQFAGRSRVTGSELDADVASAKTGMTESGVNAAYGSAVQNVESRAGEFKDGVSGLSDRADQHLDRVTDMAENKWTNAFTQTDRGPFDSHYDRLQEYKQQQLQGDQGMSAPAGLQSSFDHSSEIPTYVGGGLGGSPAPVQHITIVSGASEDGDGNAAPHNASSQAAEANLMR